MHEAVALEKEYRRKPTQFSNRTFCINKNKMTREPQARKARFVLTQGRMRAGGGNYKMTRQE